VQALLEWEALQAATLQMRAQAVSAHALSDLARDQKALLASLPERYEVVLLQLMDRLESSALFSEESCSFSQQELLNSVQTWLDKARAALPNLPPAAT
jgi:hypothetical protein